MTDKKIFIPRHITANADDLEGNDGIGRYILLPGSNGRAKEMAERFDNLTVKDHVRGHHLYLGTISYQGKKIDVATVASGMGCPSMEIILHELFALGGKRFLRVGTAGSLQPTLVKIGDIINVQASVRDEQTTIGYVPIAAPAVASFDVITAIMLAAQKLKLSSQVQIGTVHCKSSLYAREFGAGPNARANKAFINLLTEYGVLASEMETAALFIQSQFYNHQLLSQGSGAANRALCGAILGIVSVQDQFVSATDEKILLGNLISLGFETIKLLYQTEQS